jgi:hypothetical protein
MELSPELLVLQNLQVERLALGRYPLVLHRFSILSSVAAEAVAALHRQPFQAVSAVAVVGLEELLTLLLSLFRLLVWSL